MPRPIRSQGRPGTPVVSPDWETSHAVVATKTMTGTCEIRLQGSTDTAPVMNADLSYGASTPVPAIYTGPCRVQVLNAKDAATMIGEQDQRTVAYLVSIDRAAPHIPFKAVVKFTDITDPTLLTPRRLTVVAVDRGSLRFERDLYCVDDMTREA